VRDDSLERNARERTSAHDDWADFVTRNLGRRKIRIAHEPGFQIGARVHLVDEFMVARFKTVAGRAQLDRGSEEIAIDGRNGYAVYLPLAGEHELTQFHRSVRCTTHSVTMITQAEPASQIKYGDNDTVYFFMPRSFVDQRVIGGENLCARAINASDGTERLAFETLKTLQRESASMSEDEFRTAARLTGELLLLAFRGTGDVRSEASSVRAANLARVKRTIGTRLADPDVTLADIAGECGLSLRYLHDLFREDGRTAWEYVRCERLQRARHLLENLPALPITDVSMSCGFSSPSQFATAFRRAYGISPRDTRQRH
jgi:AraC-like DNA-binding protein/mannose-6-phosphate isomerase-like protein (cupin superfamily)